MMDAASDRAPARVEWAPARVRGRSGRRLLLILRAPGCAWALGPTGGCTICGFLQLTTRGRTVAAEDLVAQAASVLGPLSGGVAPDDILQIDIYNSGSFFHDAEVPVPARLEILELAAAPPPVEVVLVESRPEYVTEEAVGAAVAAVSGKRLEVGIGLESASEDVREGLIRKGFGLAEYEQAAGIVGRSGADLLTYVLLKPRGLSEAEAVEDSVRTITYVFDLGRRLGVRSRVALQPVHVLAGTALAEDWRAGRYRPPLLRSVVEVLRRTADLGDLHVGISDEGMDTLAAPRGCDLRESLRRFQATGVLDAPGLADCE